MQKECPHENTKQHGTFQVQKLVIADKEVNLEPVLGRTVEIEECLDCGEVRKEYYQKEIETKGIRNSDEHRQHSYKTKETYYTNGGNLVEKDLSGNYYWNGHKMTGKELQNRMTQLGDKMGRQDVSDQFKELAHEARKKSEEITHKKQVSIEKLRDAVS